MKEIGVEVTSGTVKKFLKGRVITIDNSGPAPLVKIQAGFETQYPDGKTSFQTVGLWEVPYVPNQAFDMFNPLTGDKIGSFTSDQLATVLYSLFVVEAHRRGYV